METVDEVVLTKHPENQNYRHIAFTLLQIRPDIWANGGDKGITNKDEVAACKEIGCKMVGGVGGGKVQSSSWLIENFLKNYPDKSD